MQAQVMNKPVTLKDLNLLIEGCDLPLSVKVEETGLAIYYIGSFPMSGYLSEKPLVEHLSLREAWLFITAYKLAVEEVR